jgi:hypothetical protein
MKASWDRQSEPKILGAKIPGAKENPAARRRRDSWIGGQKFIVVRRLQGTKAA